MHALIDASWAVSTWVIYTILREFGAAGKKEAAGSQLKSNARSHPSPSSSTMRRQIAAARLSKFSFMARKS
jgi:hypothetical protein